MAVSTNELGLRSARVACIWLSVESPILRIVILFLALQTHSECRHTGLSPVVGNPLNDREAWPAIRTVCKRVTVSSAEGVKRFFCARLTHTRISYYRSLGYAVFGGGYIEVIGNCIMIRGDGSLYRVNACQRRGLVLQPGAKSLNLIVSPPRIDENTLRIVYRGAAQSNVVGDPPNCRSKPNTLHNASYSNALASYVDLGCWTAHVASFHTLTRLFPESDTTTVSSYAVTP